MTVEWVVREEVVLVVLLLVVGFLEAALVVLLVGLVTVWLRACYAVLFLLVGPCVYVLSSWVWASSGFYLVCIGVLPSVSCPAGLSVSARVDLVLVGCLSVCWSVVC